MLLHTLAQLIAQSSATVHSFLPTPFSSAVPVNSDSADETSWQANSIASEPGYHLLIQGCRINWFDVIGRQTSLNSPPSS
jgi:hypothetical protein